jgi:hypothetical protein
LGKETAVSDPVPADVEIPLATRHRGRRGGGVPRPCRRRSRASRPQFAVGGTSASSADSICPREC